MGKDRKLCPLSPFDFKEDRYCREEECAWWDETEKRCVAHAFRLFEEWLKFLNAFLVKKENNEQN